MKDVFDAFALVPVVWGVTRYLELRDICALISTCKKLRVMWRIKPKTNCGTFEKKAEAIRLSREWRIALRIVKLIKSTFGVEVNIYKTNPFDVLPMLLKKRHTKRLLLKQQAKQKEMEQAKQEGQDERQVKLVKLRLDKQRNVLKQTKKRKLEDPYQMLFG